MKYGVAVTITQTGYIENEVDCEEEVKAKAAGAVSEERILYHETEVKECKIEGYIRERSVIAVCSTIRLRWVRMHVVAKPVWTTLLKSSITYLAMLSELH